MIHFRNSDMSLYPECTCVCFTLTSQQSHQSMRNTDDVTGY